LHGVSAPRYWETGNDDNAFRYNNYLSRYHWRHIDLMDVLSGYQPRATAPLHDIASLLGFPGKLGMSGKDVWPTFLKGGLSEIRHYCETDVLNTWLVYLHFERMRGNVLPSQHAAEIARVRGYLAESGKAHFEEFLAAWPDSDATPG
jgi:predicted PolB exonuclease-like 3'-5' exonuclease